MDIISKAYWQWVDTTPKLSVKEFTKSLAELEFKLSQLFDKRSPLRKIIVDGLHCSFRYSTNLDIVVVDFWRGPACEEIPGGKVQNPVKTINLPQFIDEYCNPEGVYVLESFVFLKT